MKTVSFLPDDVLDFIEFAEQLHADGSDAALEIIVKRIQQLPLGSVESIILAEISLLMTCPHTTQIGWDTNQLLLYVSKNFSLGISILHVSPPHLLNAVSHGVYLVIGNSNFAYSRHRTPSDCARDIFDKNVMPFHVEDKTLVPGEVLTVHAGIDIIDWSIEVPVVLLRYISAPNEQIQWTFHKSPVRPWFVASVDPGATQLSALCAYFAAALDLQAVKPMGELLAHRNHQVRWEATQSLWKLDRKMGYKALLASLNDPHPHVRNTASRSLQKLKRGGYYG